VGFTKQIGQDAILIARWLTPSSSCLSIPAPFIHMMQPESYNLSPLSSSSPKGDIYSEAKSVGGGGHAE